MSGTDTRRGSNLEGGMGGTRSRKGEKGREMLSLHTEEASLSEPPWDLGLPY